ELLHVTEGIPAVERQEPRKCFETFNIFAVGVCLPATIEHEEWHVFSDPLAKVIVCSFFVFIVLGSDTLIGKGSQLLVLITMTAHRAVRAVKERSHVCRV